MQRALAVVNEGRANEQKKIAIQAETDASRQRDIALRSLKKLVFSVQDRMEGAPALQELKIALLKEAQDGLKEMAGVAVAVAGGSEQPEAGVPLVDTAAE